MNNKTCLIVSNCKSCWDTGSKLAFVSESTPDYLDTELIKTINYKILEGPWKSQEYRYKSQQFVVKRVTRYRKELTSVLNSALGIDYSEKAWGILLDSWLLNFTSVVHDRVNKLQNAQEKLGDIFLKRLREDPQPIYATVDFVCDSSKDLENQQIYCDIAKIIGIQVESCTGFLPGDEYFSSRTERESEKLNADKFYRLKNKVYSLVSPLFRWWVQYRKPLVVVNGFFPYKKAILILLRSFGKVLIIPDKLLLKRLPSLQKNEPLRNLLKVTEKDQYDFVANKLFSKYFPLSMLEGIKDYSEKISKLEEIPILGSAGGFHFNEEYKILASRLIENGNKIVGFQHGGNYNYQINELKCYEYFEKLNADKFYRWREKSLSGKYLSTIKLGIVSAYKEARKATLTSTNILFVSQRFARFIFRYQEYNADNMAEIFAAQFVFYQSLSKNISKNFLLRPCASDHDWRYKERWIDLTGGEIRFDPNAQFYQSLVSCRIYVSDHISTTWLEAFYCDVPIILFIDLDQDFIVDEVKVLFEDLQAVGIYHPTAESAASFLNEKYESIEEWWQMPETKAAADKVRNYFYTETSNNFVKEWTQELVALRDKAIKDKLNHKKSPMEMA